MRHGELLQDELVDGVLELGEGVAAANVAAGVAEALVEPSEKVEGQRAIRDGFPKIRKLLRHVLEAPAKVHDGKITLSPDLPRNWSSRAHQTVRAVAARSITISARSVEIMLAIQDLTTQSMRVQSGKSGAGRSTRT